MNHLILFLSITTTLSVTLPNTFTYTDPFSNLTDGTWNQISGTPSTYCSDGSPYAFFLKLNHSNPDLIIFFQGGGACFDGFTCLLGLFEPDVGNVPNLLEPETSGFMYSDELKERNMLFISYCTADVHVGDRERTVLFDTLYHNGLANAKSAIDWMAMHFQAPERLLITGCSAGGYGAIAWTPYIESVFSAGVIGQFSDASVGVGQTIPLEFWGSGFLAYNDVYASITAPNNEMPDLIEATAIAYPNIQFAQFTHLNDIVQIGFGLLSQSGNFRDDAESFLRQVVEPNFAYFAVDGTDHCISELNWDDFVESDIHFVDFINDISSGKPTLSAAPWIIYPNITTEAEVTSTNFVETTISASEVDTTEQSDIETLVSTEPKLASTTTLETTITSESLEKKSTDEEQDTVGDQSESSDNDTPDDGNIQNESTSALLTILLNTILMISLFIN